MSDKSPLVDEEFVLEDWARLRSEQKKTRTIAMNGINELGSLRFTIRVNPIVSQAVSSSSRSGERESSQVRSSYQFTFTLSVLPKRFL